MAAPSASTPFLPYVYQSPQASITPFQILGTDAQIVQIHLKPGEGVHSEPGAMCYMSDSIVCKTEAPGGFASSVRRMLSKESLFVNSYVNQGRADGYIGLATPTLAKIIPIDLTAFGGEILCQKDAYLCSLLDVTVSSAMTKKVSAGIFGGEGFFWQKLAGTGLAFITAGGTIVQKTLSAGEVVIVDAGCVVAMTRAVNFDVQYVGSIKRVLFGGEGLFHAHLTGPGVVFLQSLPFKRLASRAFRSVVWKEHKFTKNATQSIYLLALFLLFSGILFSGILFLLDTGIVVNEL